MKESIKRHKGQGTRYKGPVLATAFVTAFAKASAVKKTSSVEESYGRQARDSDKAQATRHKAQVSPDLRIGSRDPAIVNGE